MTNDRMEEITAHARQAAMRAIAGYAVPHCPDSYTLEEAKLWTDRFQRGMKGQE